MIVSPSLFEVLAHRYAPSVARRLGIFYHLMTAYSGEDLQQVYPPSTICQYRRMLRNAGIDVPIHRQGRPPGRRLPITPDTSIDDILKVYKPSTLKCQPYRDLLREAGLHVPWERARKGDEA